MCALCGRPGLAHDDGGFPVTLQAGESGSSSGSEAAALSAGAQAQISYLSGVTPGGTIAGTSFWTWNYNNPATYSTTSWANKWGSTTPGTSGGTVTYWFDAGSGWTATEKAALQSGLALWSAVANINFALASSAGTANFIFYEGTGGSAYENSNSWGTSVGSGSTGGFYSTGTVISIDTDVAGFGPIGASFGTYGGYPYQTLLHEIGHLIGLGHGGPYNGNVNAATQQFSAYDTRLWTIMSYINPLTTSAKYYSSYPVTGTNWGISADGYYNVPTTMMILDIAAAQQLYGASTSSPLTGGNHVFGFNSNLATSIKSFFDFTVNTNPVVTLWATGTNNTLDLSGWSNPATINLNPGTFSSAHGLTNNIGIAEGAVIDKAIGGGGADNIIGSSYDNTLTGKGGSDTINGAGGSDTAVFSGSKSQYQITQNADSSIRLADLRSGSPDGTDTVSNVEFFQFADGIYSAANLVGVPAGAHSAGFGHADFDADGRYDMLWRNDNGALGIWEMNGASVQLAAGVGAVPSGTKLAGVGDFNGDGVTDILWRDYNGATLWQMNGSTVTLSTTFGLMGPGWTIAGVADFNGDNRTDIVWRNDNGVAGIWLMDGTNITEARTFANMGSDWKIAGLGDFDGDGKNDILWRNDNGVTGIWLMDGTGVKGAQTIGIFAAEWHIAGVNDFNNDGRADILWQNDNGAMGIWEMNSFNAQAAVSLNPAPASSHVAGTADFNGDGHGDILWRADNGDLTLWTIVDTQVAAIQTVSSMSSDWHVFA